MPASAVLGVLRPVTVVCVLARAQISGLGVERFQQSVQRPGSHQGHVRFVDVVFLDVAAGPRRTR